MLKTTTTVTNQAADSITIEDLKAGIDLVKKASERTAYRLVWFCDNPSHGLYSVIDSYICGKCGNNIHNAKDAQAYKIDPEKFKYKAPYDLRV